MDISDHGGMKVKIPLELFKVAAVQAVIMLIRSNDGKPPNIHTLQNPGSPRTTTTNIFTPFLDSASIVVITSHGLWQRDGNTPDRYYLSHPNQLLSKISMADSAKTVLSIDSGIITSNFGLRGFEQLSELRAYLHKGIHWLSAFNPNSPLRGLLGLSSVDYTDRNTKMFIISTLLGNVGADQCNCLAARYKSHTSSSAKIDNPDTKYDIAFDVTNKLVTENVESIKFIMDAVTSNSYEYLYGNNYDLLHVLVRYALKQLVAYNPDTIKYRDSLKGIINALPRDGASLAEACDLPTIMSDAITVRNRVNSDKLHQQPPGPEYYYDLGLTFLLFEPDFTECTAFEPDAILHISPEIRLSLLLSRIYNSFTLGRLIQIAGEIGISLSPFNTARHLAACLYFVTALFVVYNVNSRFPSLVNSLPGTFVGITNDEIRIGINAKTSKSFDLASHFGKYLMESGRLAGIVYSMFEGNLPGDAVAALTQGTQLDLIRHRMRAIYPEFYLFAKSTDLPNQQFVNHLSHFPELVLTVNSQNRQRNIISAGTCKLANLSNLPTTTTTTTTPAISAGIASASSPSLITSAATTATADTQYAAEIKRKISVGVYASKRMALCDVLHVGDIATTSNDGLTRVLSAITTNPDMRVENIVHKFGVNDDTDASEYSITTKKNAIAMYALLYNSQDLEKSCANGPSCIHFYEVGFWETANTPDKAFIGRKIAIEQLDSLKTTPNALAEVVLDGYLRETIESIPIFSDLSVVGRGGNDRLLTDSRMVHAGMFTRYPVFGINNVINTMVMLYFNQLGGPTTRYEFYDVFLNSYDFGGKSESPPDSTGHSYVSLPTCFKFVWNLIDLSQTTDINERLRIYLDPAIELIRVASTYGTPIFDTDGIDTLTIRCLAYHGLIYDIYDNEPALRAVLANFVNKRFQYRVQVLIANIYGDVAVANVERNPMQFLQILERILVRWTKAAIDLYTKSSVVKNNHKDGITMASNINITNPRPLLDIINEMEQNQFKKTTMPLSPDVSGLLAADDVKRFAERRRRALVIKQMTSTGLDVRGIPRYFADLTNGNSTITECMQSSDDLGTAGFEKSALTFNLIWNLFAVGLLTMFDHGFNAMPGTRDLLNKTAASWRSRRASSLVGQISGFYFSTDMEPATTLSLLRSNQTKESALQLACDAGIQYTDLEDVKEVDMVMLHVNERLMYNFSPCGRIKQILENNHGDEMLAVLTRQFALVNDTAVLRNLLEKGYKGSTRNNWISGWTSKPKLAIAISIAEKMILDYPTSDAISVLVRAAGMNIIVTDSMSTFDTLTVIGCVQYFVGSFGEFVKFLNNLDVTFTTEYVRAYCSVMGFGSLENLLQDLSIQLGELPKDFITNTKYMYTELKDVMGIRPDLSFAFWQAIGRWQYPTMGDNIPFKKHLTPTVRYASVTGLESIETIHDNIGRQITNTAAEDKKKREKRQRDEEKSRKTAKGSEDATHDEMRKKAAENRKKEEAAAKKAGELPPEPEIPKSRDTAIIPTTSSTPETCLDDCVVIPPAAVVSPSSPSQLTSSPSSVGVFSSAPAGGTVVQQQQQQQQQQTPVGLSPAAASPVFPQPSTTYGQPTSAPQPSYIIPTSPSVFGGGGGQIIFGGTGQGGGGGMGPGGRGGMWPGGGTGPAGGSSGGMGPAGGSGGGGGGGMGPAGGGGGRGGGGGGGGGGGIGGGGFAMTPFAGTPASPLFSSPAASVVSSTSSPFFSAYPQAGGTTAVTTTNRPVPLPVSTTGGRRGTGSAYIPAGISVKPKLPRIEWQQRTAQRVVSYQHPSMSLSAPPMAPHFTFSPTGLHVVSPITRKFAVPNYTQSPTIEQRKLAGKTTQALQTATSLPIVKESGEGTLNELVPEIYSVMGTAVSFGCAQNGIQIGEPFSFGSPTSMIFWGCSSARQKLCKTLVCAEFSEAADWEIRMAQYRSYFLIDPSSAMEIENAWFCDCSDKIFSSAVFGSEKMVGFANVKLPKGTSFSSDTSSTMFSSSSSQSNERSLVIGGPSMMSLPDFVVFGYEGASTPLAASTLHGDLSGSWRTYEHRFSTLSGLNTLLHKLAATGRVPARIFAGSVAVVVEGGKTRAVLLPFPSHPVLMRKSAKAIDDWVGTAMRTIWLEIFMGSKLATLGGITMYRPPKASAAAKLGLFAGGMVLGLASMAVFHQGKDVVQEWMEGDKPLTVALQRKIDDIKRTVEHYSKASEKYMATKEEVTKLGLKVQENLKKLKSQAEELKDPREKAIALSAIENYAESSEQLTKAASDTQKAIEAENTRYLEKHASTNVKITEEFGAALKLKSFLETVLKAKNASLESLGALTRIYIKDRRGISSVSPDTEQQQVTELSAAIKKDLRGVVVKELSADAAFDMFVETLKKAASKYGDIADVESEHAKLTSDIKSRWDSARYMDKFKQAQADLADVGKMLGYSYSAKHTRSLVRSVVDWSKKWNNTWDEVRKLETERASITKNATSEIYKAVAMLGSESDSLVNAEENNQASTKARQELLADQISANNVIAQIRTEIKAAEAAVAENKRAAAAQEQTIETQKSEILASTLKYTDDTLFKDDVLTAAFSKASQSKYTTDMKEMYKRLAKDVKVGQPPPSPASLKTLTRDIVPMLSDDVNHPGLKSAFMAHGSRKYVSLLKVTMDAVKNQQATTETTQKQPDIKLTAADVLGEFSKVVYSEADKLRTELGAAKLKDAERAALSNIADSVIPISSRGYSLKTTFPVRRDDLDKITTPEGTKMLTRILEIDGSMAFANAYDTTVKQATAGKGGDGQLTEYLKSLQNLAESRALVLTANGRLATLQSNYEEQENVLEQLKAAVANIKQVSSTASAYITHGYAKLQQWSNTIAELTRDFNSDKTASEESSSSSSSVTTTLPQSAASAPSSSSSSSPSSSAKTVTTTPVVTLPSSASPPSIPATKKVIKTTKPLNSLIVFEGGEGDKNGHVIPLIAGQVNYAKQHGYEIVYLYHNPVPCMRDDWAKITGVKGMLTSHGIKSGNYVTWMGNRMAIINPNKPLEDFVTEHPEADLIVGSDLSGKNADMDFFIIRKSEWSDKLMKEMETRAVEANYEEAWTPEKVLSNIINAPPAELGGKDIMGHIAVLTKDTDPSHRLQAHAHCRGFWGGHWSSEIDEKTYPNVDQDFAVSIKQMSTTAQANLVENLYRSSDGKVDLDKFRRNYDFNPRCVAQRPNPVKLPDTTTCPKSDIDRLFVGDYGIGSDAETIISRLKEWKK